MMNDAISDMLTRIRNAQSARHTSASMPYSKMREAVAQILKGSGFIADAKVEKHGAFQQLVITLATDRQITALERVSKPGRRVYTKSQEIPLVVGGRGIVIVSTSSGLMTGREARKRGLGGELICKVW